ncbi:MAG: SusD/RagB family nutrient-binding outer membrane lipoprotein [Bacteroidetes bacterium]|nr:MAG: SusD/RagB family nutrient-binding outer membrane lipoprotein [Bacteroidota bacterium]
MKLRYIKFILFFAGLTAVVSCKKYFDINKDPDRLPSNSLLYPQLLTSAQVAMGFEGGSDLFRYTSLITQHMSGQASQPNQTYEYGRYNISGNDQNNVWGTMYATTLSDLELLIKQATTAGSPHYSGLGKILKAFEYVRAVDTWGDVPYTEAEQLDQNKSPKYDDDEAIYTNLIQIINDGINEMNATTSVLSPGTNSVLYTNSTWATARALWIKFANTLKLRIYIHYSKKNSTFCVAQINSLVNTSGVTFMGAVADGFQMQFYSAAGQQSPITQFEVNRPNYLFCDARMLQIMTTKGDPRRPFYFTSFPYQGIPLPITPTTSAGTAAGSNTLSFSSTAIAGAAVGMSVDAVNVPIGTTITAVGATSITLSNNVAAGGVASGATVVISPSAFVGVSTTAPPVAPNNNYSRIHTYLRGPVSTGSSAPPFTYTGQVMQRMLPYAEYCFIRAEASLMGATSAPLASAEAWYQAGITASMDDAGVNAVARNNYLTTNGTLTGTAAQQLQKIIEEKFIATFGVSIEPWTDWRRTGYPVLAAAANGFIPAIPRSFFYPQSEIDFNPNCPGQKGADLQSRIFWDN